MREELDGGDAADACRESARAGDLRDAREHAAEGSGAGVKYNHAPPMGVGHSIRKYKERFIFPLNPKISLYFRTE